MKHWKALTLNGQWIVAEFDDVGNYTGKIANCGNEAIARRIATVPELEAAVGLIRRIRRMWRWIW